MEEQSQFLMDGLVHFEALSACSGWPLRRDRSSCPLRVCIPPDGGRVPPSTGRPPTIRCKGQERFGSSRSVAKALDLLKPRDDAVPTRER
jgi:hypothetical protein